MKAYALDGTTAVLFADKEDEPWNGFRTPVVTQAAMSHYLSQVLCAHGYKHWEELSMSLSETYHFDGPSAHGNGLMWTEVAVPDGVSTTTNPAFVVHVLTADKGLRDVVYAEKIAEVIDKAKDVAGEANLCGEFEEAIIATFGPHEDMLRATPAWDVSVTLINYVDAAALVDSKKFGFKGDRSVANVQMPDDNVTLRGDVEWVTESLDRPDRQYAIDWLTANGYVFDELELNHVERNDDDC